MYFLLAAKDLVALWRCTQGRSIVSDREHKFFVNYTWCYGIYNGRHSHNEQCDPTLVSQEHTKREEASTRRKERKPV